MNGTFKIILIPFFSIICLEEILVWVEQDSNAVITTGQPHWQDWGLESGSNVEHGCSIGILWPDENPNLGVLPQNFSGHIWQHWIFCLILLHHMRSLIIFQLKICTYWAILPGAYPFGASNQITTSMSDTEKSFIILVPEPCPPFLHAGPSEMLC